MEESELLKFQNSFDDGRNLLLLGKSLKIANNGKLNQEALELNIRLQNDRKLFEIC